jgi:hypothetical protein
MCPNIGFTIPTQGQLDNLVAGCYVRIQDDKDCYWVEVDEVSDHGLSGVIHTELEGVNCRSELHNKSRVCFQRDQVTHVGCDRYCFC